MVDVIFDGAVRNLQLGENTDLAAISAAAAAASAALALSYTAIPIILTADISASSGTIRIAADEVSGPSAVVFGRKLKDWTMPASWVPANAVAALHPAVSGFFAGPAAPVITGQAWATALGFTSGASFGEALNDAQFTGLVVQEASANAVTNSSTVGMASGTVVLSGAASIVGQLPFTWSTTGSTLTGVTMTVSDVPGDPESIDIRYQNTGTAGVAYINMDQRANNAASTSQAWTAAAELAIVAGSFTNVSDIGLGLAEWTSGGTLVATKRKLLKTFLNSAFTRFSNTATTEAASTQQVTPLLSLGCNGSGACDVTIRIRRPWLRQGTKLLAYAQSTGSKATRPADALGVPLTALVNRGPQLVRNGSPTANAAFWIPKAGDSVSASAGYLIVTEGATDNSYAEQVVGGFVVGRSYEIRVTGNRGTAAGNAAAVIGTTAGGTQVANLSFTTTSDVTQTVTWTATVTQIFVRVGFGTNALGQATRFTAISAREVSPQHSLSVNVLPGPDDGVALEYAKSTTAGFRVYRSGFDLFGVARIAGSDGTPQRLTVAPPILPVSIVINVDPAGNITARADGGPIKTFTGGDAFDTLWLGCRYDGSSYWNGGLGKVVLFPQTGIATQTLPRLVDSFDRANGAIGAADSGQAWICVPAAAPGSPNSQLPVISSSTCVVTNPAATAFATYFSANTAKDFSRVFAVASFGAGTAEYGAVALILSGAADGADNGHVLLKSLHVVFSDKSILIQTYIASAITTLEAITYAVADTTNAKVLKGYEFDPDTGTIKLWSSGNYYERTFTALAKLFAPGELSTVTFEHFGTPGATIRVPTFHKVWAD